MGGNASSILQTRNPAENYSETGKNSKHRMLRRYSGEPVPSVTTDLAFDNLGRITAVEAGTTLDKSHTSYVSNEHNIDRQYLDPPTGWPYNRFVLDAIDKIDTIQRVGVSMAIDELAESCREIGDCPLFPLSEMRYNVKTT